MGKGPSVVIVGGGIAGLTAAHELVERDFQVTVYEHRWRCGGKAASARVAVSGVEHLPGEHGFHFFPGWYRHLPDTLGRIPSDRHRGHVGHQSVLDHLVTVGSNLLVSYARDPIPIVLHAPRSADQAQKLISFCIQIQRMGLSMTDSVLFFGKLVEFLSVPDDVRRQKYDAMSWTEFIGLDERTAAFQVLTAHTRCLIAANPHVSSAYTIATMAVRTMVESSFTLDRILDGPTSEVWIEPWVRYLEGQGVVFRLGHDLDQIHFSGAAPHIESLRFSPVDAHYLEESRQGGGVQDYGAWRGVRHDPSSPWPESHHDFRAKLGGGWLPAPPGAAASEPVKADYFLFALPIEQMAYYVNRSSMMTYYDESLRNIVRLSSSVEWMAGIQFYFRTPINLEPGHVVCADSEWSLTAIDQTQFWRGRAIPHGVQSILSVDISAWNKKGRFNKKEAFRCSKDEIAEEVFAQLSASFNRTSRPPVLHPNMLISRAVKTSYHLDDNVAERYDVAKQAEYSRAQAVRFSGEEALAGAATEDAPFVFGERTEMNVEPILVNRPGALAIRPGPHSDRITNMFLAGDYLDTATNLACMEGANESARRAVNALLEQAGSNYERCRLWDFSDQDVLSTIASAASLLRQGPAMQKAFGVATSAVTTIGGMASRAAQSLLQAWNKR